MRKCKKNFHVKQIFCSFFIYINLISILYQSYINLISPYNRPLWGVFILLISRCLNYPILHVQKILNILTTININNLHHTKIICNFVS